MTLNDNLTNLKKRYNAALERNAKAEHYFKTKSVSECMKFLDLFNEVIRELSELIYEIERIIGDKLTYEVKINGFQEVQ